MRAILAYSPDANARELRQMALGAGLDCAADDCVPLDRLALRLGATHAQVIVLHAAEPSLVNWGEVADATALSSAPILLITRGLDDAAQRQVRQMRVHAVIDSADAREALDDAIQRLPSSRETAAAPRRGLVFSVIAPKSGSGGTTVAVNLAGALAAAHPGEAALIELAPEGGDIALLLDVKPRYTAADICQRWKALDASSLPQGFCEHKATPKKPGLHVLANGTDDFGNPHFNGEAIRRIAILSRVAFGYTVLALDSRMGAEELDAMRLSDAVLLVLRADVPSARFANRALQTADEQGIPRERLRIVVNRWGQSSQLPLKRIESLLGMKVAATIPDDPGRVNKAVNAGQLLEEVSRMSSIRRSFASLASQLNGQR